MLKEKQIFYKNNCYMYVYNKDKKDVSSIENVCLTVV